MKHSIAVLLLRHMKKKHKCIFVIHLDVVELDVSVKT